MKNSESIEMYLETILLLQKMQDYVRAIDIATELGYSKPSVSNAMKSLKCKGYITVSNTGQIELTEQGREIACEVQEKNRVLTELLLKIGMRDEVAKENACRMEHVVSGDLIEVIKRAMASGKVETV